MFSSVDDTRSGGMPAALTQGSPGRIEYVMHSTMHPKDKH